MFTPIDAITLMHGREAQPPPPPSPAFKFQTLQLRLFFFLNNSIIKVRGFESKDLYLKQQNLLVEL